MLSGLPSFLQDEEYPFLVAQAGAAVLPAVVALALGAAIMRLRGIGASIATFAFLMIIQSWYSNWDRTDIEHRDLNRPAPFDLEIGGELLAAIDDSRNVGRRATHIERHQIGNAQKLRHLSGGDNTTRRSG